MGGGVLSDQSSQHNINQSKQNSGAQDDMSDFEDRLKKLKDM